MISPHLRKGCFQRLWKVEIKLCTNMQTVPASSTVKSTVGSLLSSCLAKRARALPCWVWMGALQLKSSRLSYSRRFRSKLDPQLFFCLLASACRICCVRFQSIWCLAVYFATKVIQKYLFQDIVIFEWLQTIICLAFVLLSKWKRVWVCAGGQESSPICLFISG